MAADNVLVQSGKALYDQQATQVDTAGAVQEGKKLITDQIEKNLDFDFKQKKREYELDNLEDQKFLREMDIEKKVTAHQADKAAYFDLIEQAHSKGLIDDTVYETSLKDRENWYKDQTTALKLGADAASLKRRLKSATAADGNWGKALEFSKNAAISSNSEQAFMIDLAIEGWARKNGSTPPPIKTIDGKDMYEIPNPDGGDPIHIPVDSMANLQSPSDIFGQYDERVTFEGFQANFIASNPKLDAKFRDGKATKQDFNQMMQWFDTQVANNTQLVELADSMIQSVPGANHETLGISDLDGDGKVSGADFDTNKDGEISGPELENMRTLFGEVVKGQYDIDQLYTENQNGNFSKDQVNTYNAFSNIKKSGGSLNSLLSLPGVFDIQIDAENGRGVIFLGDSRKEQNAFIVPVDANGRITPEGYQKLAAKFNLTDINPKANEEGASDTTETPAGETTETTTETTTEETTTEEGTQTETSRRGEKNRGAATVAAEEAIEAHGDVAGIEARIKEIKDSETFTSSGRRGKKSSLTQEEKTELRRLELALEELNKEDKPSGGTTQRRSRRRR